MRNCETGEMKNLRKVGEVGVKGLIYKSYAAH
jgi:hypothetical protein